MVRTRVMGLNCSRRILGEDRRVRLRQTCHSAKLFPLLNGFDTAGRRLVCCTLRRRSPPNHMVDSTSYRARLFFALQPKMREAANRGRAARK